MSKRQEKTPPKTAMESEKQHPRKGGVGNKRKIKWEQYQEKDHRRMWSIEANRKGPPENVVYRSKQHRQKPAKWPMALAEALPNHSKIRKKKCAAVGGRRGRGHLL